MCPGKPLNEPDLQCGRTRREECRSVRIRLVEVPSDCQRVAQSSVGRRVVYNWEAVVWAPIGLFLGSLETQFVVERFDIRILNPLCLESETFVVQGETNQFPP